MKYFSPKPLLVGFAMVLAAGLALAMRPSEKVADRAPAVNLESMIPAQFSDWTIDATVMPLAVSPDVKAKLDQIYNQTLSRTYVNGHREKVMLSIAYGGDQSDNLQVHRPEVCYTAQGFQVLREVNGELVTRYGQLPVKRLVAQLGARHEPITYWITVGDRATHPGLEQKLAQLRYSLTGRLPDGMLVRVSSISPDEPTAFGLQERFISDMLAALKDSERVRLVGVFGA